MIVFYVPGADEVERYRRTGAVSTDETAFAALLGPDHPMFVSLTPPFASSGRSLASLYFDEARAGRPNGHWTGEGHALAAEFITPLVRRVIENLTVRSSTSR